MCGRGAPFWVWFLLVDCPGFYLVLVVAGTISTSRFRSPFNPLWFRSPWKVWGAWPWKVLSCPKKKKLVDPYPHLPQVPQRAKGCDFHIELHQASLLSTHLSPIWHNQTHWQALEIHCEQFPPTLHTFLQSSKMLCEQFLPMLHTFLQSSIIKLKGMHWKSFVSNSPQKEQGSAGCLQHPYSCALVLKYPIVPLQPNHSDEGKHCPYHSTLP